MPAFTITDQQRQQVIDLYQSGTKTAHIIEQTGVARSSIYAILRRAGLRPSRLGADLPDLVDDLETENEKLRAQLAAEREHSARLLGIIEHLTGAAA